MTFPAYWLFGFLNYAGWPRTKGLFIRKKIVSSIVLWSSLTALVQAGIALGALRPKIAVSLLADLFTKRNWQRHPATELWNKLDPSEQISNQPDKPPEQVIANFPITVPNITNPEEVQRDLIAWENALTESFSAHYHCIFAQGLIWGLSHPEESLGRYEKQRQRDIKKLPVMLQAGLKVQSPATFEEFADAIKESVNAFQNEIRPFDEIPQELLSLPVISTRLNSI